MTNAVWSTNCWLRGVQGLSATCIGHSNGMGGRDLVTMISPRHFLFSQHTHPEGRLAAFLDTYNALYWRTILQRVDLDNDLSIGILDQDLPSSVGYLPVVPTNVSSFLPTNSTSFVQGVGMNQDMRRFSQPMYFQYNDGKVWWNNNATPPLGLSVNWNVVIRSGDSGAPGAFLIGNQLTLLTHNFAGNLGPNYSSQFNSINQYMHYLSTNNNLSTDYQLTTFSLTNWPAIH